MTTRRSLVKPKSRHKPRPHGPSKRMLRLHLKRRRAKKTRQWLEGRRGNPDG